MDMIKYFRSVFSVAVLILSFCILPILASALGDPGDPGGDPDLPIDGGVVVLVAVGAAYGIKKVRDQRKRNTDHTP
jgi:hypothetical protein